MNTPRQQVEQFHLLFLEQLSRNLDSKLYAIKGGCNLRFFFKSIRYSEDLDIDVQTIAVDTLKNKINRLLSATPFQYILKTHSMKIDNISLPKQTATTQRWKISLRTDSPLLLNTKIEFSRRGMPKHILYEAIDPAIIQSYRLMPILTPHYDRKAAFVQKIMALAGRPQTQARDVFDLFLLNNTSEVLHDLEKISPNVIEQAQQNALAITFSDFKSQVVAFLAADYQQQYDDPVLWENTVTTIIDQIELLKS